MAINWGTLLIWMLQQALLYARGLASPNHPAPSDPFPPLGPGEALQQSLGRLLQEFSGETLAHEARVNAHMARMEHSPIRRVCQRREGEASFQAMQRGGEDKDEEVHRHDEVRTREEGPQSAGITSVVLPTPESWRNRYGHPFQHGWGMNLAPPTTLNEEEELTSQCHEPAFSGGPSPADADNRHPLTWMEMPPT